MAQRSLCVALNVAVDEEGQVGVVLLCVFCKQDELLFACGVASTVYDLNDINIIQRPLHRS